MQSVKIPWAAWYSDEKFELTFPAHWNLTVAEMKGGPDIGDEGIRQALANPIGTPPLGEFAQGRRSAAILVDDLSRPTSFPWKTIIFSPGVNRWDVRLRYSDQVHFCKTWPEVISALERTHGAGSHVALFPCGALQYSGEA